jgi:4-hydroxy-2-oxoheptanedioate aldolase
MRHSCQSAPAVSLKGSQGHLVEFELTGRIVLPHNSQSIGELVKCTGKTRLQRCGPTVQHEGTATMESGKIRLGGWLAIADSLITEAAGRAGYDWVGLDLQHGAWDLGSAIRGIQLLDVMNVPVLVRIADDELHLIPHLLDQGAAGIVIAMTSSPETVAAAIARARYLPEGQRSYGGQRYGLRAESADVATIRPGIFAMIETREAVERITAIASVPGIAGIHVGPVDLCLGLGLGKDRSNPIFTEALQTIVAVSHAVGLPAIMHAVGADQVSEMVRLGFDELVLTADIALIRRAFAAEIGRARGIIRESHA